jgi:hypothetical protein
LSGLESLIETGASFNSWPCSGTFGSDSFLGPGGFVSFSGTYSVTVVAFILDFAERLEVVFFWFNLALAFKLAFLTVSSSSF